MSMANLRASGFESGSFASTMARSVDSSSEVQDHGFSLQAAQRTKRTWSSIGFKMTPLVLLAASIIRIMCSPFGSIAGDSRTDSETFTSAKYCDAPSWIGFMLDAMMDIMDL